LSPILSRVYHSDKPFGDFTKFRAKSCDREENAWLISSLERFSNGCRKTEVIIAANHNKPKLRNEPIRTQSVRKRLRQRQIGFGFTSDWLRKWCQFLKPITKHSKAEPKQMQITLDSFRDTSLLRTVHFINISSVIDTSLLRGGSRNLP